MKNSYLGVLAIVCVMVSSCATPKDITYMQGFENNAVQAVCEQHRIKVQPDDQISIVVSSKDPQLAEVFNLAIAQYRVGYQSQSNYNTSAYTVDPDGNIYYPVIGKIHIAGLTRHEVSALLQSELVGRDLLKDPVVTVQFLNAKVSVLGDVAKPGEYPIEKDNLTILQALSMAGDLNITGKRTQVLVVREENGQDRAYRLDLTDTRSLMESPAYYLQQNDVVYIEPNSNKKRQATTSGNTVFTPAFWISVASLLSTIVAIIIR